MTVAINTTSKLGKLVSESGLRQYQIAGACFIHPTTFSDYINLKRDLLPDHLVALCKFFKLPPETLLGKVDDGT